MYYILFLLLVLFSCGGSDEGAAANKENKPGMYIGNWHVYNEQGDSFYITVNPDGMITSTWGNGQHGQWHMMEGKMVLEWSDGWRDVLFVEDGEYKKVSYKPGASLDAEPTAQANAKRVESIPTK